MSEDTAALHANALTASLTVNDLQKSLDWYCNTVGFAVAQKYERNGVVQAISLTAGDVRMLIGQDDGAKGKDRVKGQGISLMLTTSESIDDIANRIKANGGTLETEPADMPWGPRMFRLRDPDGFILTISSR